MGKRNERFGKRNHGNYWISWMIDHQWWNHAGIHPTPGQLRLFSIWHGNVLLQPTRFQLHYCQFHGSTTGFPCIRELLLCLLFIGIDGPGWSARLLKSMDKRKHGPLTRSTLAPYQGFFILSSSNRTLIITTALTMLLRKLHVVGQSLSHPNQLGGSSNSVSLRRTYSVHTPYGVTIYIAFSGGQRRRRMI